MTLDLIQLFENKEVRVFAQDEDYWIPVGDLATAWGIDRTTPAKIISRNAEVFQDLSQYCDVTSQSTEPVLCVNERGLYLLMGKVSANRLKNDMARAAIIRFQRWVPELIQQFRKKEIVLVPPACNLDLEIQEARHLAELTSGDPRQFMAAALRKCGKTEYADALLKSAPALVHGETGWLTAGALGERCGLNAREINAWLYNHDFQYPQNSLWRLQPKGEAHGEEYWYEAPSGHREIRIRWRESILIASGLKREDAVQQPAALASG